MASPQTSTGDLPEPKTLECAILFVDLRDSTVESAYAARSATTEARRMAALHDVLIETSPADCQPDFIKSTGDGLMSAWHVGAGQQRLLKLQKVLSIAVGLDAHASQKVAARLGTGKPEIGIGLTRGSVAHLHHGQVSDYIGFPANLAAKLQDRARPHGLVVEGLYIKELHELPEGERDLSLHEGLSVQHVLSGSTLSVYGIAFCYISQPVRWTHDWRCLAWPGFAGPDSIDAKEAAPGVGLNTRGITVLTHEGLQGKVGTLEIWTRHVKQGDSFEMIIDDFDTLQLMSRLKMIKLKDDLRGAQDQFSKRVCSDLFFLEEKDFVFLPIRCGINALVWNKQELPWLDRIDRYRTIKELLDRDGGASDGLAPSEIGFYDNLGATLPILMLMMHDHIGREQVYEAGPDLLTSACEGLSQLTDKFGRFQLYEKTAHLSWAVHHGKVKLVLGGGAWLVDSCLDGTMMECQIPEDGGFLWVEGAAITNRAAHGERIIEFLCKEVLDREFQLSLGSRKPYGASPVTKDAIGFVLNGRQTAGAIDAQTKKIFTRPDRLSAKLSHRRCPANERSWLDAWSRITEQCCERVQIGQ